MKYLVLGADGFLGSHVVEALLADGAEVRAFDRFPDGAARNLADHERLELVNGDFLNRNDLDHALRGVERVLHFVSMTTPATSGADPVFDVETNVRGSIELLKLCVQHDVQHILFTSTGGAIYGQDSNKPLRETDVAEPVSPYAIGKLAIEGYLRFFAHSAGLNSTVLRVSNPFGERQNVEGAQGAIPIFLRLMQLGEPLQIFGDGSMRRDYIYVRDFTAMVMAVLAHNGPPHSMYNLGSGHGVSVLELVRSLEEVTGLVADVRLQPSRPTDVDRVVLDMDRFIGDFGITANTPLKEGIARTWKYVETLPLPRSSRPEAQ